MKIAIVLLAVLPFICAMPNKRAGMFLNTLGIDENLVKHEIQLILDQIGSDGTEQQCEASCMRVAGAGTVFSYGCPFMCHGFQETVHRLHLVPDATTVPV